MIEQKNRELRDFSQSSVEVESLSQQLRGMNDHVKRLKGENEGLFGEVRDGQEKLRLSSNQISKLGM